MGRFDNEFQEKMENTAIFQPIASALTLALLDFVGAKNLNKTVEIDGKSYTLVFISKNSSAFFRSRGLSVYFKTGRSIIRISDHWAASVGNDKSRKLNCGGISGNRWIMTKSAPRIYFGRFCGKYPWVMLAGKCGLRSLNRTCDHFLNTGAAA